MLERNALIYKKGWYFLVSGFFEPLLYLLSLGIGLNHLIGVVHIGTTAVTYSALFWRDRPALRHGRDRWMGRSAAPCRSARPHTPRDDRR